MQETESYEWILALTMQFATNLHASIPRVKCAEHGVKQVNVPWAVGIRRFTLLFERFAINVLLSTQTVTGAQLILNRAGIKPKGQSYFTLLYDLHRSTVEAMSEGCDASAANACFAELSEALTKLFGHARSVQD